MGSDPIPADLRQRIIERAGNRCEYCKLSQAGQEATFHIDHVIPRAHGGRTELHNLALACVSCSLRKGARQAVPDPETGRLVRLFNPWRNHWEEHFRWTQDVVLVRVTEIGRATVEALALNRQLILAIRRAEMVIGRHPPG